MRYSQQIGTFLLEHNLRILKHIGDKDLCGGGENAVAGLLPAHNAKGIMQLKKTKA